MQTGALGNSTTDLHKKSRLRGQTEPGLVALYDIQPWNEAGLFLQPRSQHRVVYVQQRQYNINTVLHDIILALEAIQIPKGNNNSNNKRPLIPILSSTMTKIKVASRKYIEINSFLSQLQRQRKFRNLHQEDEDRLWQKWRWWNSTHASGESTFQK